MANDTRITRRRFLREGTAAGAAALGLGVLAASSRNPATTARAAERRIGANDRLAFGVIAAGGRGGNHIHELLGRPTADNLEVIAVSDVYVRRVKHWADRCKGKGYADYRALLDNKDVDCVVVATPDHWHFKNAMDAIDAGKQVFLEKPMVHSAPQAIALRNKVRETGAVLQVGTQHTAVWRYWAAHEAIKGGLIGHPLWSQASYSRNSRDGQWNYPMDDDAGPDAQGDAHVDWDMWLGHEFGCAPKIPWNRHHFFQFRKYWPYSGGVFTDLFYHKLAPMVLALEGPNGQYPLRVSTSGGIYLEKDDRDVPDTCILVIDYPTEHSIVVASSMANEDDPPERIRGHHGTIVTDYGTLYGALRETDMTLRKEGRSDLGRAFAENVMKEEFRAKSGGQDEVKLEPPSYWTKRREDHMANFIDVVREKEKQLNCNVELGTAVQIAITMGMMSYRQRKTLIWDAQKEEVKVS